MVWRRRTLLVKFVGTCCGVCANVSLGPEAPTVHIGACVADNITHLACGRRLPQASIHADPALKHMNCVLALHLILHLSCVMAVSYIVHGRLFCLEHPKMCERRRNVS